MCCNRLLHISWDKTTQNGSHWAKGVGRSVLLLKAPGDSLFLAFRILCRPPVSLLMAFPRSKLAMASQVFLSLLHPSIDSSPTPASTFKDPCDYNGPTWTIQANLLILRSAEGSSTQQPQNEEFVQ